MPKKSLQQLMADWKVASNKMQKFQQDLPRVMGEEAVKIIKQNFNLGGYDDGNGFKKWKDRGKVSKVKGTTISPDSNLLRQTLNLYNSIMHTETGRRTFVGTNTSLVPYAKIHNEGGIIQKKERSEDFTRNRHSEDVLFKSGKRKGDVKFKKGRFAKGKGEGSGFTFKAHEIKIPKRQFIPANGEPPNQKIIQKISKKIISVRNEIMKDFKK